MRLEVSNCSFSSVPDGVVPDRKGHATCPLPDVDGKSRILLHGGEISRNVFDDKFYVLESADKGLTWSWTVLESKVINGKDDGQGDDATSTIRIVICGGEGGATYFSDTQVWELQNALADDPSQMTVALDAKASAHARGLDKVGFGHSCTQVGANLYLFGGYTGEEYNQTAYTTPAASLSWRPLKAKDQVPIGRNKHSAVEWMGKRLCVFGGRSYSKMHGDLQVYDAATNMWSEENISGDVPSARFGHGAVMMDENHMLVVGGWNGNEDVNDAYMVDLLNMRGTRLLNEQPGELVSGTIPCVSYHSLTKFGNDRALVFGGETGSVLHGDAFLIRWTSE